MATWQTIVTVGLLPAIAAVGGAVFATLRSTEIEKVNRAYHFAAGVLFTLVARTVLAFAGNERQRLAFFVGLFLVAVLIIAMEDLFYSPEENGWKDSRRTGAVVARSVEMLAVGMLIVTSAFADPSLNSLLIIILIVVLFLFGLSTGAVFMTTGQGRRRTIGIAVVMALIFLLISSAGMLLQNSING